MDSPLPDVSAEAVGALAAVAKAWPFEQARLVVERLKRSGKGVALFETGYGPSGLPHIGTFGEVVRTTMVRNAFRAITDDKIPTRLIAFSDDMDGMRKVPPNVPNSEMLTRHLGMPLTSVPDPFGEHESFAHHNNARLRAFLDSFGFEYEFLSSTQQYKSGVFDEMLLRMLDRYDAIMAIMLPTLGEDRRATYSPFLPISPKTGKVLQVPTLARNFERGTIVFEDEDGSRVETPVTGGHVKIQWKPDWALRWAALGVDYEMSGKDLIDSVKVSSQICRALGAPPPEGFNYELFLDERGERISKTKGNGLAVEEWLRYAPPESLSLYQFQKPKTAKRLYFDVIPKAVDEYLSFLDAYPRQNAAERLENAVWHIHAGAPPAPEETVAFAPATNEKASAPITFALLLNLVSAANAETKAQLWAFIAKYAPAASPTTHPFLDRLTGYAIAYYDDFVKPTKRFRAATDKERAAFLDLIARFDRLPADLRDGEAIQAEVYAVGKEHAFEPLREWFKALYEVLFGQEAGPRFGSFAAIFGLRETAELMRSALDGAFIRAA
ncbi:MAG: lysine--tRNA ligase [Alphaproteobacteria bacterium]|nr:lysine--tRNA ligase [Alphaproteobacteria bacterium]